MSLPQSAKTPAVSDDDAPVADRGQSYDKAGAGDIGDENFGAGGDYRGEREFGGFSDQDFGSQGYSGQGYGDRSYGDPDYGGQTFARRGTPDPALDSASTESALTSPPTSLGGDPVDAAAEAADAETRRPDREDEDSSDGEARS